MYITRYPQDRSIIVPIINDNTDVIHKPLTKEKIRTLLNVLMKIGIVLLAASICVLANKGAIKLDEILNIGNTIQMFSYIFSLMIGVLTSTIVFE